MVDAMQVRLEPHQLHLGTFAAVDHKIPVLDLDQLRRGKSAVGRQCPAGSEYGDVEAHDAKIICAVDNSAVDNTFLTECADYFMVLAFDCAV